MDRYIVLRREERPRAAFRPESFGAGPAASSAPPRIEAEDALPQVAVESLDIKQLRDAKRDPAVEAMAFAMPMTLIKPVANGSAAGTDGECWGLGATKADASPFTGESAVVAVLDTGIDRAHEAFAGVELIVEDFTGGKTGHDGNGHGTHCAGTIFGRPVGGKRIGVAPGIKKALIGKVLRDDGSGDSDMVFKALEWAADYDDGIVDVISMSLGFDFPGYVGRLINDGWPHMAAFSRGLRDYHDNLRVFDVLMQRINRRRVRDEGVLVIAAAGNENIGSTNPQYRVATALPAAAEGVISVGAADRGPQGFKIASFSNSFPVLSAPGVGILSAKTGGGLTSLDGTSMACPHVAGIAALWWDKLRRDSPEKRTSAKMVEANLRVSLRKNVFAPDVTAADCGDGLVTAP